MDDNLKLFNSAPYLEEMMLMDNEATKVGLSIDKYVKSKKYAVSDILDIPCGLGRLSIELTKLGYNVTGIDISNQFLSIAKTKSDQEKVSKKIKFVKADMYNDDLKTITDKSPDLILNWWTSIGYKKQSDDINFFKKLHKLSHNGTIFMLETWHRNFILSHPIKRTWKQLKTGYVLIEYEVSNLNSMIESKRMYFQLSNNFLEYKGEFKTNIKLYDLSDLAKMLINSGWEVIEVINNIENLLPFNPNTNGLVIVSKFI